MAMTKIIATKAETLIFPEQNLEKYFNTSSLCQTLNQQTILKLNLLTRNKQ